MEKKEWKTPELTVLVRSKPEEAVLAACKDHNLGPASANAWCAPVANCPGVCLALTLS
jgi:hypothetical protein